MQNPSCQQWRSSLIRFAIFCTRITAVALLYPSFTTHFYTVQEIRHFVCNPQNQESYSRGGTMKELTNTICHLLCAYYCGSPTLPLVHYKLFHSVRNKTFQCKNGILQTKKVIHQGLEICSLLVSGSCRCTILNWFQKTLEVHRFFKISSDILRFLATSWCTVFQILVFFQEPKTA